MRTNPSSSRPPNHSDHVLQTVSDRIVLLLSGNQVKRAIEECQKSKHNLPRLALKLSCSNLFANTPPLNESSRRDNKFFPIHKILSGDFSDLKDPAQFPYLNNRGLVKQGSWLNQLGLRIWYTRRNGVLNDKQLLRDFFGDLGKSYPPELIASEKQFGREIEGVFGPGKDGQKSCFKIDLAALLIKFYAFCDEDGGFFFENLHSFTYTNNPLKTKVLWVIVFYLCSLRSIKTQAYLRLRLTKSFISELEQLGLWHYGAFILMLLAQDEMDMASKERLVKELIFRNLEPEKKNGEIYKFFEGLGELCPQWDLVSWLDHATAVYHASSFNYEKAVEHFIRSGDLNAAHRYLCKNLAPEVLIEAHTFAQEAAFVKKEEISILNKQMASNLKKLEKVWKFLGQLKKSEENPLKRNG